MLITTAILVITILIVLFVSIVAIGCIVRARKHKKQKSTLDPNADATVSVRLNMYEDGFILSGGRLISTITWFRGDHTIAAKHIQQRLQHIIQVNTWLMGQIKSRYGANYLVYTTDARISNLSDVGCFVHLEPTDSPLSFDTPLEGIADIVRKHCNLIFKPLRNQPVYRVAIVPCNKSPLTHFALLVSMSHIVGDGHTFYTLYNALLDFKHSYESEGPCDNCPNNEPTKSTLDLFDQPNCNNVEQSLSPSTNKDNVPELTVPRVQNFHKDLMDVTGSRREPTLSMSLSFLIPCFLSLVLDKVRNICYRNRFRIQRRYMVIDQDQIALMKKTVTMALQQPPESATDLNPSPNKVQTRCSLNDVVTSWLFQNCPSRHGFMTANMRERMPSEKTEYTNSLAGNYMTLLYYPIKSKTESYTNTSMTIRQSLVQLNQQIGNIDGITSSSSSSSISSHHNDKKVKSPIPLLLFGGGIVVTNWTSLRSTEPDGNITLPDGNVIHEELHCPLYTYQIDKHPSNLIIAFIYRMNCNQIGLLVCGSSSNIDTITNDCPFAGTTSPV